MNYLIKFDENGRRGETYVVEEKSQEEVQALLDNGFELVPEEDYQLIIGNVDGKEYIRTYDTEGNPSYIEYEPPEIPLEELKAAKLAELKLQRDTAEVLPIQYNGNSYDYDEKARDRINAAIIALELQGEQATIEWTLADNGTTTVTANDLKGVIASVAVRSNTLHAAYRNAKEKVEEAQSKEELDAIVLGE